MLVFSNTEAAECRKIWLGKTFYMKFSFDAKERKKNRTKIGKESLGLIPTVPTGLAPPMKSTHELQYKLRK